MSANYEAVTMDQGAALDLAVDVTDGADGAGAAVSLTGATITWVLTRGRYETTAVLSKSSATAGSPTEISLDPVTAGRFHVHLAPGDTLQLAGDYWHEARVVDAAGAVTFSLRGNFFVRPTAG